VRNAIAHSFFPENRRQYAEHKKAIYRDSDIYSKDNMEKFVRDFDLAIEYLWSRAGWA